MWTSIGLWLLNKLPIDRIVAIVINALLNKLSGNDEKVKEIAKKAEHITEIGGLLMTWCNNTSKVLEDGAVSEQEVAELKGQAQIIAQIISKYAKGEPAKELEQQVK